MRPWVYPLAGFQSASLQSKGAGSDHLLGPFPSSSCKQLLFAQDRHLQWSYLTIRGRRGWWRPEGIHWGPQSPSSSARSELASSLIEGAMCLCRCVDTCIDGVECAADASDGSQGQLNEAVLVVMVVTGDWKGGWGVEGEKKPVSLRNALDEAVNVNFTPLLIHFLYSLGC